VADSDLAGPQSLPLRHWIDIFRFDDSGKIVPAKLANANSMF